MRSASSVGSMASSTGSGGGLGMAFALTGALKTLRRHGTNIGSKDPTDRVALQRATGSNVAPPSSVPPPPVVTLQRSKSEIRAHLQSQTPKRSILKGSSANRRNNLSQSRLARSSRSGHTRPGHEGDADEGGDETSPVGAADGGSRQPSDLTTGGSLSQRRRSTVAFAVSTRPPTCGEDSSGGGAASQGTDSTASPSRRRTRSVRWGEGWDEESLGTARANGALSGGVSFASSAPSEASLTPLDVFSGASNVSMSEDVASAAVAVAARGLPSSPRPHSPPPPVQRSGDGKEEEDDDGEAAGGHDGADSTDRLSPSTLHALSVESMSHPHHWGDEGDEGPRREDLPSPRPLPHINRRNRAVSDAGPRPAPGGPEARLGASPSGDGYARTSPFATRFSIDEEWPASPRSGAFSGSRIESIAEDEGPPSSTMEEEEAARARARTAPSPLNDSRGAAGSPTSVAVLKRAHTTAGTGASPRHSVSMSGHEQLGRAASSAAAQPSAFATGPGAAPAQPLSPVYRRSDGASAGFSPQPPRLPPHAGGNASASAAPPALPSPGGQAYGHMGNGSYGRSSYGQVSRTAMGRRHTEEVGLDEGGEAPGGDGAAKPAVFRRPSRLTIADDPRRAGLVFAAGLRDGASPVASPGRDPSQPPGAALRVGLSPHETPRGSTGGSERAGWLHSSPPSAAAAAAAAQHHNTSADPLPSPAPVELSSPPPPAPLTSPPAAQMTTPGSGGGAAGLGPSRTNSLGPFAGAGIGGGSFRGSFRGHGALLAAQAAGGSRCTSPSPSFSARLLQAAASVGSGTRIAPEPSGAPSSGGSGPRTPSAAAVAPVAIASPTAAASPGPGTSPSAAGQGAATPTAAAAIGIGSIGVGLRPPSLRASLPRALSLSASEAVTATEAANGAASTGPGSGPALARMTPGSLGPGPGPRAAGPSPLASPNPWAQEGPADLPAPSGPSSGAPIAVGGGPQALTRHTASWHRRSTTPLALSEHAGASPYAQHGAQHGSPHARQALSPLPSSYAAATGGGGAGGGDGGDGRPSVESTASPFLAQLGSGELRFSNSSVASPQASGSVTLQPQPPQPLQPPQLQQQPQPPPPTPLPSRRLFTQVQGLGLGFRKRSSATGLEQAAAVAAAAGAAAGGGGASGQGQGQPRTVSTGGVVAQGGAAGGSGSGGPGSGQGQGMAVRALFAIENFVAGIAQNISSRGSASNPASGVVVGGGGGGGGGYGSAPLLPPALAAEAPLSPRTSDTLAPAPPSAAADRAAAAAARGGTAGSFRVYNNPFVLYGNGGHDAEGGLTRSRSSGSLEASATGSVSSVVAAAAAAGGVNAPTAGLTAAVMMPRAPLSPLAAPHGTASAAARARPRPASLSVAHTPVLEGPAAQARVAGSVSSSAISPVGAPKSVAAPREVAGSLPLPLSLPLAAGAGLREPAGGGGGEAAPVARQAGAGRGGAGPVGGGTKAQAALPGTVR
ncbi:hypothetical protein HYH03_006126 [Edaphochlamys debaryana]|uniref:Uncharacterized protein n=1 Tax=Edaphochlamys debaryana TaxID=47281 RepID=A0A835Y4N1_9CHLO|nr:hypothetical protein HYH03_006126 [Edaphochlamys debaryana]|eukprot:KAG2495888.1 hypothetical protein HYH03_006126 [Edaphochlamys debaryana]